MKKVYVVYREDNTMVFNSQVLEYLKLMNNKKNVNLIVFRNHVNFFKKKEVELKISKYVNDYVTFPSLPPLSTKQLDIDAFRLKRIVRTKYNKDEPLLIICRGELSTYIATKAFSNYTKSKILFDNRGLPVEEIEISGKRSVAFKLNKSVKLKATLFAKTHSDMYPFVTNNLRDYLLKKYEYSEKKPYFIMPTLHLESKIDEEELKKIKKIISYNEKNFYITYMGSVAAWQNINQVFKIYSLIKKQFPLAKLLLITNGTVKYPDFLEDTIVESITVKSVPHHLIKYYLSISQLGLVLRNNNIVNKVAAPTKIAEYLSAGVPILYDGEIGIIDDLSKTHSGIGLIKITDNNWMEKVESIMSNNIKKEIKSTYDLHFNMIENQENLLRIIMKEFNNNA